MSDFLRIRVNSKSALRAICSKCGETGDRTLKSGTKDCEQPFAEKMFRNLKWRVGKDRSQDICPECVKAEKNALKELSPSIVIEDGISLPVEPGIEKPGCPGGLATHPVGQEAEALVDLLRDHLTKRSNGTHQYKPGFTDASIASACGVPVERVREVRTTAFGLARLSKGRASRSASASPLVAKRLAEVEQRNRDLESRLVSLTEALMDMRSELATTKAETGKTLQGLVTALTGFQGRLEELSDEFDHLSEPVSVSPRTVLQLFRGQAKQANGHRRNG